MKKLYSIFLLLIFILKINFIYSTNQLFSQINNNHFIIKECLEKIQKLPEACKLIKTVQEEGAISIRFVRSFLAHQFGAYWDPENRIIGIGYHPSLTEGKIIGSILFELHNASVNAKIEKINDLVFRGKIKKIKYVKLMEKMEYENSKKASEISRAGIQRGIFSYDAYLPTYRTFKEHFKEQIKSGHSACFERNYDNIRSFNIHN